jgi:hypothetical protein
LLPYLILAGKRGATQNSSLGAHPATGEIRRLETEKRANGQGSVYFATAKNRYVAAVTVGYDPVTRRVRRKKVFSRTREGALKRLQALQVQMPGGVKYASKETN